MMGELLLFFIGSFISLFSIVDPLMAAPVFVSLTPTHTQAERIRLARRAATYTFWILLVFFIAGSLILGFFGISIDALRIAGGVMIISSSYGMITRKDGLQPEETQEARVREDIAFSPLAMPLMSGPGAIAVLIGMTADARDWPHYVTILLVIMAVGLSCYWTLRLADPLVSRLGPTLMKSFIRIMGFILLCVGVQFIVNGVHPILTRALTGIE